MTDFQAFTGLKCLSKAWAATTLLAGTLDIVGAITLSLHDGRRPLLVLQSIAGAILGKAAYAGGLATAVLGLTVHFCVMSLMVAAFMVVASKMPFVLRAPVMSGAIYGLFLFSIMYYVVLPLRWPSVFPTADAQIIVGQLACHVALVGLPIAFATRAFMGQPRLGI